MSTLMNLILTGGVLYIAIYAYKKFIKDPLRFNRGITKKFKKIGTVKEILVYPLDGGPGQNVNVALCTKTGIKGGEHQDRCHIAYSPLDKKAFLNVHYPALATQDISNLWVDLEKFQFSTKRAIRINYLGRTMKVQENNIELTNKARNYLENIVKEPQEVRMGFCSPENREHLNANKDKHLNRNATKIVDDFSPYLAPYTLINSKSLEYLKNKTGAAVHPSNFRANIVIEGLDAFCEEDIFCLKIGKVFFYNTKPCTHVPSAFVEQANIKNPEKLQPYRYLRKRSPKNVRPPSDGLKFPTFGITMELGPIKNHYYPKIEVGDVVVAQLYYYKLG